MSQEIIIKKKRKRKDFQIIQGFQNVNDSEVLKTEHELRVALKKIFKSHIGEVNSITPYDLFVSLFNISPTDMNVYQRTYWWNIVKKVLRTLRSDLTLFVINKGTKLFVLQTEDEAKMFKGKIDRDIERMKLTKKKADEWVTKKLWRGV